MKESERCQTIKDILKDVEMSECKNDERCEIVKDVSDRIIRKECMPFNYPYITYDESIDKMYMYRGTSIDEAQNVLKSETSGGFWSNYFNISYLHGGLLVAKNKEPELKWKGEIPKSYHLSLKDIIRIYVDADLINVRFPSGLIQVYPVLTESEFGTLCETPTARKLASQLYTEYVDAVNKYELK